MLSLQVELCCKLLLIPIEQTVVKPWNTDPDPALALLDPWRIEWYRSGQEAVPREESLSWQARGGWVKQRLGFAKIGWSEDSGTVMWEPKKVDLLRRAVFQSPQNRLATFAICGIAGRVSRYTSLPITLGHEKARSRAGKDLTYDWRS
jgi:hypothetical protein